MLQRHNEQCIHVMTKLTWSNRSKSNIFISYTRSGSSISSRYIEIWIVMWLVDSFIHSIFVYGYIFSQGDGMPCQSDWLLKGWFATGMFLFIQSIEHNATHGTASSTSFTVFFEAKTLIQHMHCFDPYPLCLMTHNINEYKCKTWKLQMLYQWYSKSL